MSANFKKVSLAIVGIVVIAVALLLAYEKKVGNRSSLENKPEAVVPEKTEVSLPDPSGKPSDILEGALAGIEVEGKLEASEDSLAKNSLDDTDEVSAFSNAYEETNF
ncbi:MAG: hypothetical protein ACOYS2_03430 [Patescibacteria group bacterium]